MSIRKRIGRAGIAALLVAAGLVGIAHNASAETTTSVTTNGVDNACTADWGFVNSPNPSVSIDWDSETLQWPTSAISLGDFHFAISATGEPNNRGCKWTFSNGAFLNGSTQLLPATALQQTGSSNAQFGANFGFTNGIQIPLGSPGSGDVPANQFVRNYAVEIDPLLPSPSINQQAPAGTYTSTITFTITALAPL